MKIYWISKCTTTGYSFPLFSFLLKKSEEEKENERAKPVLSNYYLVVHLIFTRNLLYLALEGKKHENHLFNFQKSEIGG